MASRRSTLGRALRWLVQDRFLEGVAIILAVVSAGIGSTFLTSPGQNANSRGFRAAMDFLDPAGWAVLFISASVVLILLVVRPKSRRDAMWPALALSVAHGGIALAFLATVGSGAVPTGAWAYSGFCALAALLTAACALTREDHHAASPRRLADHP